MSTSIPVVRCLKGAYSTLVGTKREAGGNEAGRHKEILRAKASCPVPSCFPPRFYPRRVCFHERVRPRTNPPVVVEALVQVVISSSLISGNHQRHSGKRECTHIAPEDASIDTTNMQEGPIRTQFVIPIQKCRVIGEPRVTKYTIQ